MSTKIYFVTLILMISLSCNVYFLCDWNLSGLNTQKINVDKININYCNLTNKQSPKIIYVNITNIDHVKPKQPNKAIIDFNDVWYPNITVFLQKYPQIPSCIQPRINNTFLPNQRIPRRIIQTWINHKYIGPYGKKFIYSLILNINIYFLIIMILVNLY